MGRLGAGAPAAEGEFGGKACFTERLIRAWKLSKERYPSEARVCLKRHRRNFAGAREGHIPRPTAYPRLLSTCA